MTGREVLRRVEKLDANGFGSGDRTWWCVAPVVVKLSCPPIAVRTSRWERCERSSGP